MAKISETVRGYFINRIETTLSKQISILTSKSAVKKTKIVEKKMKSYLKELGVYTLLEEYKKAYSKERELNNKLFNVCKESGMLKLYESCLDAPEDFEYRFKDKLSQDIENYFNETTKEGKAIAYLKRKKTEAVDRMYLVTDNDQIEATLCESLEGTNIRLLNGQ